MVLGGVRGNHGGRSPLILVLRGEGEEEETEEEEEEKASRPPKKHPKSAKVGCRAASGPPSASKKQKSLKKPFFEGGSRAPLGFPKSLKNRKTGC